MASLYAQASAAPTAPAVRSGRALADMRRFPIGKRHWARSASGLGITGHAWSIGGRRAEGTW